MVRSRAVRLEKQPDRSAWLVGLIRPWPMRTVGMAKKTDPTSARHAMPNNCPRHPQTRLVAFCPACRGAMGGRRQTEAQKSATRRNVLLARAKRAERKERS